MVSPISLQERPARPHPQRYPEFRRCGLRKGRISVARRIRELSSGCQLIEDVLVDNASNVGKGGSGARRTHRPTSHYRGSVTTCHWRTRYGTVIRTVGQSLQRVSGAEPVSQTPSKRDLLHIRMRPARSRILSAFGRSAVRRARRKAHRVEVGVKPPRLSPCCPLPTGRALRFR